MPWPRFLPRSPRIREKLILLFVFVAALPLGRPVGLKSHQAMTQAVHPSAPGTPLADAVALCLRHTIGALPVLQDGIRFGVITQRGLLRALRDSLGAMGERKE